MGHFAFTINDAIYNIFDKCIIYVEVLIVTGRPSFKVSWYISADFTSVVTLTGSKVAAMPIREHESPLGSQGHFKYHRLYNHPGCVAKNICWTRCEIEFKTFISVVLLVPSSLWVTFYPLNLTPACYHY